MIFIVLEKNKIHQQIWAKTRILSLLNRTSFQHEEENKRYDRKLVTGNEKNTEEELCNHWKNSAHPFSEI